MNIVIIGNSHDIIKTKKGEFIDSCDRIIRINSFKIHGVEEFVGSRVDIVSICLAKFVVENALVFSKKVISKANEIWSPSWPEYFTTQDFERAKEILEIDRNNIRVSNNTEEIKLLKSVYDEVFCYANSRQGIKTSSEDGRKYLPTTGFLTLKLAKFIFSNSNIFITGFGLDSEPTDERFDDSKVPMWEGHDLPTERALLQEGISNGSWLNVSDILV